MVSLRTKLPLVMRSLLMSQLTLVDQTQMMEIVVSNFLKILLMIQLQINLLKLFWTTDKPIAGHVTEPVSILMLL
jgi:hypothetical protein